MTKRAAKEWAKAKFGRHEDGRLAARVDPEGQYPWVTSFEWLSDAHMAADPGWSIVRDAESLTSREHIEKAWEKAHETDVIPAGAGCITKWASGGIGTDHTGAAHDRPAKSCGVESRLLDPPAPAWHSARIIEAWHDDNHQAARWARADDGTWLCLATHHHPTEAKASELHDVTVIVGADDQTKGQDQ